MKCPKCGETMEVEFELLAPQRYTTYVRSAGIKHTGQNNIYIKTQTGYTCLGIFLCKEKEKNNDYRK